MIQGSLQFPLENFPVFASSDMDEVIDIVTNSYCSHELRLKDRNGAINARHHRLPFAHTSVNYLQYGAEVAVNPGEFEDFFMLEFPLSGAVYLNYGKDQLVNRPGGAAMLSPGRQIRSVWTSECAEIMFKLNKLTLESHLSDLLGRSLKDPLYFDPLIDLSNREGMALKEFVGYLLRQAHLESPVLGNDLLVRDLEKTFMTMVLTGLQHNYSDHLRSVGSVAMPHYVSRAKRYIDSNLKEDITPAKVIEACGLSHRSVYDGFQKYLGTTPLNYIKNCRLERIREELRRDCSDQTVTEIAIKWGYRHLGRFSGEYFERFGEKPSETRRCRKLRNQDN